MDIWEICLVIASVFVSQVYSKANVTKCYYKSNVDTPYYVLEIGDGTIQELSCAESCQCNNINSYADLTGFDGCWGCCCGPVSKEPHVEGNEAATIPISQYVLYIFICFLLCIYISFLETKVPKYFRNCLRSIIGNVAKGEISKGR